VGFKIIKQMMLVIGLSSLPFWAQSQSSDGSPLCSNANIFEKIMDQVCWSCMLPFKLSGVGGDVPDGAADQKLLCLCKDDNGVYKPPGVPLGYWSPRRLIETVKVPWCSPSLGGIRLQDSIVGMGSRGGHKQQSVSQQKAFYQYHYFAYPIMEMLSIFVVPECARDQYIDFDLLFLSEIDPTWNSDLLAMILNPEAAIFANPLGIMGAAADCAMITAGKSNLDMFYSGGCDGLMYPMTGNVTGGGQVARNTSLVAQRTLASLHRKGMVQRTMGDDAMCETQYSPMIPKSMYKLSAIYPIPEADSNKVVSAPVRDSEGNPEKNADGSIKMRDLNVNCCHNLGESVHKWRGVTGETIPGTGEDYVYLLFQYTDCCLTR